MYVFSIYLYYRYYISLTHPCFLAFFIQDARFEILEDYGCTTPILDTWVLIIIAGLPTILLELISGIYECLSIHAFFNLSEETCSINNNLNPQRYIRLICFSAGDLISGIPLTLFYLYIYIKGIVPFPGLKQDYFQIYQVPAVLWRSNTLVELSYELRRWLSVLAAFLFFAIFGFTEESRNNYRTMLQPVVQFFVKLTGIKRHSSGNNAEGCVFTSFFFFLFFCFPSDILDICYLESYSTFPTPGHMVLVHSPEGWPTTGRLVVNIFIPPSSTLQLILNMIQRGFHW